MNYSQYNEYMTQSRQNGASPLPENAPETLRSELYTPGFLRQHIGKLMRIEFLIGTTSLIDRIGILEEVGASYIVIRSIEDNNMLYCDIYSIKFITISENPFVYNPPYNG